MAPAVPARPDAAGEIVATGENVTRWRPGDRAVQLPHPPCRNCALCVRGLENLCIDTAYPGHQVFGGYAQYVVRRQDAILPIPDGVDFETAAATMWTYTTPLNCARQAPVGPGDTVVITGASGGMAIACAQLAKLSGATVIGTTTKPDRDEALSKLGYDHILRSTDPDCRHRSGADTRSGRRRRLGLCRRQRLLPAPSCIRLGGTVIVLGTPTDQGSRLELDALALIGGQVTSPVCAARPCGTSNCAWNCWQTERSSRSSTGPIPWQRRPRPTRTWKATDRPAKYSSCPD